MTGEKNPPPAAAVLGAAALALALPFAVACQRESTPPLAPAAAAGNAPAASPASPPTAAPALLQAGTATGDPGNPGDIGSVGRPPVPGEPVTSELHREPQSVRVGDAPPAAAPASAQSGPERDLAARERRLAARVAALEAREKQLRRKDQAPAAPSAVPAPAAMAAASGDQDAGPDAAAARDAAAGMPQGTTGPGAGDGGSDGSVGSPAAGALEPPPWPANERAATGPVTLPAGASFEVEFTKALASNTSSVGQTFRARLLSDVRLDGATAIPAGAEILGVVTDAVAARRIGGKAKLSLKITDLVLPSGSTLPIHASFLEEGNSKTGRDAATIGGAAAGGGLLGRILGQSGKGTILGALVGAAVGTAIASRTAGEEVVIPEGSVVKIKLDEALEIKPQR